MSRFYDDGDWDYGRYMLWVSAQGRALSSSRGQAALATMEEALLSLPEPRLIDSALARNGEVCAVGAYIVADRVAAGENRQAVVDELAERYSEEDDYGDATACAGNAHGLAYSVAWRLAELNDEDCRNDTPEERYEHVLAWVRRAQGKTPA